MFYFEFLIGICEMQGNSKELDFSLEVVAFSCWVYVLINVRIGIESIRGRASAVTDGLAMEFERISSLIFPFFGCHFFADYNC